MNKLSSLIRISQPFILFIQLILLNIDKYFPRPFSFYFFPLNQDLFRRDRLVCDNNLQSPVISQEWTTLGDFFSALSDLINYNEMNCGCLWCMKTYLLHCFTFSGILKLKSGAFQGWAFKFSKFQRQPKVSLFHRGCENCCITAAWVKSDDGEQGSVFRDSNWAEKLLAAELQLWWKYPCSSETAVRSFWC